MPRSNQSGGPWGSGPRGPPDLEEFLRGGQDRLRGLMRGNFGGRGFALLAVAAVVLWGFSGFFRVEPDELGVVLRFASSCARCSPG
jgi:modulator of FtsH protease HflK